MKTREEIAAAIVRQMLTEAGIDPAIAAGTDAERIALQIARDIVAGDVGYIIVNKGAAIMCLRCGAVSHNANDVAQRYCGACHAFLEGA
jgi:ribosomal protein S27AE